MPQVVELPPIGLDARGALVALTRVCKETPAKGEHYREFRARLRAARLWDRERPAVMLRFLGTGGATVMPSEFMQTLGAAGGEEEVAQAVLDRLWHLNALLAKTVMDLVTQRAYHKDEIYKHLASASYKGALPSRPAMETWLQIALGSGLLRTLGIAMVPGPRAERYIQLAGSLDTDEFLAEDKPEPEPVIPSVADDDHALRRDVRGEAAFEQIPDLALEAERPRDRDALAKIVGVARPSGLLRDAVVVEVDRDLERHALPIAARELVPTSPVLDGPGADDPERRRRRRHP